MNNTMQKAFGGMPNMEFIIGPEGTLLAKWEWANPDELKQLLEEKIGPSGLPDDKWAELSKRKRMMVSVQNNDEVPGTYVPRSSLFPLKVEPVVEEGEEKSPINLEAGTLPPKVTPGGLSRLYLTIQPDETRNAFFDNTRASVILLAEPKGIGLKKDKLIAGRRRSGQDIYPHTLAVMWSLEEGTKKMEFSATVKAKVGKGEEPAREWTAKFRVSGPIPKIARSMDEVLSSQIPSDKELKRLQCTALNPEKVPFSVEASIYHDPANPGQGMIYLFLKVDAASGYVWNNLASAPHVSLKPVSGIELEKNTIYAANRDTEEDTEARILAFWWKKEPGAKEFVLEVTPEAWICNNNQGWCRRFALYYRISGKL